MARSAAARLVWRDIEMTPAARKWLRPREPFTLLGWGLAGLYSLAFWLVVAALLH